MNPSKCYDGIGRSASPLVALSAGSLEMVFDPANGWIREIAVEGREVVQAIYPAIRTGQWLTMPYRIKTMRFEEQDGRFAVTYEAETTEADYPFAFTVSITGSARDGLRYQMEGKAGKPLESNRIGLCVLHPADWCAGREYQVTGPDGKKTTGHFPEAISPNVVQTGICALRHEVAPGVPMDFHFEGDHFEMEDQRNYSDFSFKTYSTAHGAAKPWQLQPTTTISQSVRVNVAGAGIKAGGAEPPYVTVDFGTTTEQPLPRVGVMAASHGDRLSEEAIKRLKALHLHHVRLDLRLGQVPVMAALSLGARQAADLEAKLLVALHLGEDAAKEVHGMRSLLSQIQPKIAGWLVFPPSGKHAGGRWVDLVKKELQDYAPDAPVLIGGRGQFLELNRLGTEVELGDGLVYPASPTVHDDSSLTMMANLGGLGETAVSGRKLAGKRPLVVSPLHLRAAGVRNLRNEVLGLPGDVDLRQGSLFGAAWTVGAFQQMLRGGVDVVTMFETTGWRGLMERQKGSPAPTKFPSSPGMVFPLYHILADVGESAGGLHLEVEVERPRRVAAFGVALQGGTRRLWVANLTPEPVLVRVTTQSPAEYAWVRLLDEVNYEKATTDSAAYREGALGLIQKREGAYALGLLPYAVARLDEADAQVEEEEA